MISRLVSRCVILTRSGEWNQNNTLYLGPGQITGTAHDELRLSWPGGAVSRWRILPWLRLDKSLEERHRGMTWMQRLKRVFNIDMEVCECCGSQVKVIASIEDPAVIAHILKHLKHKAASARPTNLPIQPPERGPPQAWVI